MRNEHWWEEGTAVEADVDGTGRHRHDRTTGGDSGGGAFVVRAPSGMGTVPVLPIETRPQTQAKLKLINHVGPDQTLDELGLQHDTPSLPYQTLPGRPLLLGPSTTPQIFLPATASRTDKGHPDEAELARENQKQGTEAIVTTEETNCLHHDGKEGGLAIIVQPSGTIPVRPNRRLTPKRARSLDGFLFDPSTAHQLVAEELNSSMYIVDDRF
jgi:hypothetical protein